MTHTLFFGEMMSFSSIFKKYILADCEMVEILFISFFVNILT